VLPFSCHPCSFSGPGYRVYFLKQGAALVVLLAGGDKGSQADDITRARNLARILKEQT